MIILYLVTLNQCNSRGRWRCFRYTEHWYNKN